MSTSPKNIQNFAICLLVLFAVTIVAYLIAPILKPVEESGLDTTPSAMGARFVFMALGALTALGVCYATRDNGIWEVSAQKIVYMIIGSLIFGVFAWLFGGGPFTLPTLSQVAFRPAAVVPIFFGFMFGPAVGFMVGAGGGLVSDLFGGLVSPHWIAANGLIGLMAGLPALFTDKRQSWDTGAVITGIGGIVAGAFFLANPGITFSPSPAAAPEPLSLFLGLSVVVGCGLAIAVRFAFPNRPQWAEAAVWGAGGTVTGLFLGTLADMWLRQAALIDSVVGQFIPTAGPNAIAVAILAPLFLALYAAAQQAEA